MDYRLQQFSTIGSAPPWNVLAFTYRSQRTTEKQIPCFIQRSWILLSRPSIDSFFCGSRKRWLDILSSRPRRGPEFPFWRLHVPNMCLPHNGNPLSFILWREPECPVRKRTLPAGCRRNRGWFFESCILAWIWCEWNSIDRIRGWSRCLAQLAREVVLLGSISAKSASYSFIEKTQNHPSRMNDIEKMFVFRSSWLWCQYGSLQLLL